MIHNGLVLNQTRRIPLFAAFAAFVLFVCTMGNGMTAGSLPLTAKLAGWDENPQVCEPLVWLLTLPLWLLPAGWIALSLKILSAAIGAAVIGVLARTVQLLPWDQPWANASRSAKTLPILLACVLCGLEFGFWQQATATPGEVLDLLLLASGIWLLLEFKQRQNPRWLDAAALVWGAGMAENWLMLLTLPLFVAGLIWLLRLRFFQRKFILRMAALGLASFSIYALLPFVNGLSPHSPWHLGEAWLAALRQTKLAVLLCYNGFWRAHRLLAIAMIIYYLVPTLPLVIRLRDEGTQNKFGVDVFQLWLYRVLRFGLLLACLWLAFDPKQGPQQMTQKQLGVAFPVLSFVYLTALSAGFLLGNLLLVSQNLVEGYRRPGSIKIPWRQISVPGAAALLAIVAAGLAARNGTDIVHANFHPLEEFGTAAVKSLPAGGGVMLSDFDDRLAVFRAALSHQKNSADWLAVDTRRLATVDYRAKLEHRQHGWLTDETRHELTAVEKTRLLETMARSRRLFYLHPSHGYFFELFYLEPAGSIFEMKLRGTDALNVPPLSDAAIAANEKFWSQLWSSDLAAIAPPPTHRPSGFQKRIARYGYVAPARFQDRVLGEWFSLALDDWAVTLQRQSRLPEARVRLEQALQLNTNNISARVTLACNTNLISGVKMGLADVAKVAGQLQTPERVNALLISGGPFDEPTLGYLLGSVFFGTGLLRQAAEQFERVRVLVPDAVVPNLALAEIYNRLQMRDRARALIAQLHEQTQNLPANSTLDLDLALLDSYSWLMQTNVSNARDALESVAQKHPDDPQVRDRVLGAYLAFGDYTNALNLVKTQLEKNPDDAPGLNSEAVVLIQAGRGKEALPVLDRLLTLTNLPAARMNRAFVLLGEKNFSAAENDLRELQTNGIAPGAVNFGMAVIAQNQNDTNRAAQLYQACLTNTAAGSPLWQRASAALRALTAK